MNSVLSSLSVLALVGVILAGCAGSGTAVRTESTSPTSQTEEAVDVPESNIASAERTPSQNITTSVTAGQETYRGFALDNVLHSETEGDIHYNVYIPDSYDDSTPYALFFTLPGYEGLYFQGVGINLRSEDFGFTAQDYNRQMIVVAPQLNDWGETSAR